MTRLLLKELARSGVRVGLVDRRFSRTIDDVGRLEARKLLSAVSLVWRLGIALLRRRPTAAVLFLTNRPASFLVDSVATAVLRCFGVPVVHYVHTNGFRDLASRGAMWTALVAKVLRAATVVVTLGPSLLDDISPWVAPSALAVIPNATGALRPAPGSAAGVNVLYFSNLLPSKGADVAVALAVDLCGIRDDVRFTIAGADVDPAFSAALHASVSRSPHAERIRFTGAIRREEREELLGAADVLLFPSSYPFEAQPLSIIEAKAAGVPVVAFAVGGVADIVDAGIDGELAVAGDLEALRDALARVLDDPDHRRALGAGALRSFAARHSVTAYRAAWLNVLATIGVKARRPDPVAAPPRR